ncbi:hypothetical protein NL676_000715 [Syzygium grande]|nr:hypothetical protein NL676_000715 [Syzygium grande]
MQSTWVAESTYIYLALFSLTWQPGPKSHSLVFSALPEKKRPKRGDTLNASKAKISGSSAGPPGSSQPLGTPLEWGPHGRGQPVNVDLEELSFCLDGRTGGPDAPKSSWKRSKAFLETGDLGQISGSHRNQSLP